MTANAKTKEVREFIRQPYAWPGGYPMALMMNDGGCLCHVCAHLNYRLISQATRDNDRRSGWNAHAVFINWEDNDLYCDHCSTKIDPAYPAD